jgi:hypothetical protein
VQASEGFYPPHGLVMTRLSSDWRHFIPLGSKSIPFSTRPEEGTGFGLGKRSKKSLQGILFYKRKNVHYYFQITAALA